MNFLLCGSDIWDSPHSRFLIVRFPVGLGGLETVLGSNPKHKSLMSDVFLLANPAGPAPELVRVLSSVLGRDQTYGFMPFGISDSTQKIHLFTGFNQILKALEELCAPTCDGPLSCDVTEQGSTANHSEGFEPALEECPSGLLLPHSPNNKRGRIRKCPEPQWRTKGRLVWLD